MGAGFDHFAIGDYVNDIGAHGRGETVGDEQCGAAFRQRAEARQLVGLGPGVHGAGGLVEDENGGAAIDGAGQCDALPFAGA